MPTHEEFKYKFERPLSEKIEMSYCIIETWWKHWDGKVYISFSGGKDSTVLKHLVNTLFPEIESVYIDTGLEYPEVKDFVASFDNVVTVRPKMTYRQVVEKYGYAVPSKEQARFVYEYKNTKSDKLKDIRLNGNRWGMGKISKKWLKLLDAPFNVSHMCCDILKKNPVHIYERKTGNKPYMGFLNSESSMRTSRWMRYGCNAFDIKRPSSNPLSFWSEQDILEYLVTKNITLPSVYGDIIQEDGKYKLTGLTRTGCMWCLFGIDQESKLGENRFQMMKKTHPKIWKYCINNMGIGDVLDFLEIPYE